MTELAHQQYSVTLIQLFFSYPTEFFCRAINGSPAGHCRREGLPTNTAKQPGVRGTCRKITKR